MLQASPKLFITLPITTFIIVLYHSVKRQHITNALVCGWLKHLGLFKSRPKCTNCCNFKSGHVLWKTFYDAIFITKERSSISKLSREKWRASKQCEDNGIKTDQETICKQQNNVVFTKNVPTSIFTIQQFRKLCIRKH